MFFLAMPYAGNDHDFFGKIWLSPPYKVNGGLSRFSDKFGWPSTAYSLLRKHKCADKLDISLQQAYAHYFL